MRFLPLMLILVFAVAGVAFAAPMEPPGGLSWGMAETDALLTYGNLFHKKDEDGGRMKMFARAGEEREIAGVRFDAVRYVFTEGRLVAMVARMEPKPRFAGGVPSPIFSFYSALARLESSHGLPRVREPLFQPPSGGFRSTALWEFDDGVVDLSYEEDASRNGALWYTARHSGRLPAGKPASR